MTVFNALSWPRTDIARVEIDLPADGSARDRAARRRRRARAVRRSRPPIRRTTGRPRERRSRSSPATSRRSATGPIAPCRAPTPLDEAGWRAVDDAGHRERGVSGRRSIRQRGGAIASLVDKRTGKRARPGRARSATSSAPTASTRTIRCSREGPWHLTPDGRFTLRDRASPPRSRSRRRRSAGGSGSTGPFEESPPRAGDRAVGRRRAGRADDVARTTTAVTTACSGSASRSPSKAATPVSEVGNAVVGRPSASRTSTSPRSRSRSTIRPTTGSRSSATARVALGPTGRPRRSAARRRGRSASPRSSSPTTRRQDDAVREPGHRARAAGRHLDPLARRRQPLRRPAHRLQPAGRPARGRRPGREPLRRRGARRRPIPGTRRSSTGSWPASGWARLWVPEDGDAGERSASRSRTCAARASCRCSSSPASIRRHDRRARGARRRPRRRRHRRRAAGRARRRDRDRSEDYTVAVLNRGMPGFNVEADGNLYLSLMRSCSGWPSGVWIDPPRRATPDGANFQFQHWTHASTTRSRRAPGTGVTAGSCGPATTTTTRSSARVFDAHAGPPARRRRASSRSSRRPPS